VMECPVMPGSTISRAEAERRGLLREYEGRTYALCCEACVPKWDADPARYAT